MAEQAIAFRRRAIVTGLQPYLQHDQLQQMLALWEQEFAHLPASALHRFIIKCCHTESLKQQRMDMLRSVIQAHDMPEEKLLPDPRALFAQADENAPDEATKVFCELMQKIFQKSGADIHQALRRILIEHLPRLTLSPKQLLSVNQWLHGHQSSPGIPLPQAGMRAMVSLVYVDLCEYLGPVKADLLLASAVTETEQSSAAAFSVHRLL